MSTHERFAVSADHSYVLSCVLENQQQAQQNQRPCRPAQNHLVSLHQTAGPDHQLQLQGIHLRPPQRRLPGTALSLQTLHALSPGT